MKGQMKDDATLFSRLNLTPSQQTFTLCVLDRERGKERMMTPCAPPSLSPLSFSLQ